MRCSPSHNLKPLMWQHRRCCIHPFGTTQPVCNQLYLHTTQRIAYAIRKCGLVPCHLSTELQEDERMSEPTWRSSPWSLGVCEQLPTWLFLTLAFHSLVWDLQDICLCCPLAPPLPEWLDYLPL